MGRTVAIVQARMGSTRLPGKILLPLAAQSVLGHVLTRCAAIAGVDDVCCATTDLAEDDVVAAEAARHGAAAYRGPAEDVLARYAGAAQELEADVVLRVTSDCPAIDPAICGALLDLRKRTGAGYAANNMPPSWPHGLDCEAFTRAALNAADANAARSFEREHVSPWMREAAEIARANLAAPPGLPGTTRWTLDYPEDYAFLKALFRHLPGGAEGHAMAAVLGVLADHPEIAEINLSRHGATKAAPFGALNQQPNVRNEQHG
ncbi:MAG: glycosyltransferase family protein [Alphaproteobacteria bacterium]|jgi:glutamate-1-semialdehyde 2,1-aminomutase/spore coat polysaccharide biosynthesis protein SpsF|nr:glycosyltransferase family protein [Alphaproteobacteria bacterium]MDP6589207.1 glycosyltransferase family protein [Alphaproteobacteria bacterium]MDP6816684.1 glycosyltransferase family protein [Alphaproteobacteria bacterium]|tara:strand:- start:447 stop:1232 length:786 start_codon:yes stop_codon:yes gene_type:complete